MSSFSRETEFTKCVCEEIATARFRHASSRHRIPMPDPRLSPSYRAVSYGSAMGGLGLPGETVSLPACTQRSICRGAASASRLGPQAFSGDKRGRSKALFFAAQRDIHFRPRTCQFFMRPRELGLRTHPFRLGDDSSPFAVPQQQWCACSRRMLRCTLACILPSSSSDPRLASGSFTVAKDKNRDRFIGDRRPLNSRERSIGGAHLPHCPWLRRLISGRSETVQITIRDTKDFF